MHIFQRTHLAVLALLISGCFCRASDPAGLDFNPLALPEVWDHEMHILSPGLIELTVISTRPPDPNGTGSMTWKEFRDQGPSPSQFSVSSRGQAIAVKQVGFKRRVLYAPLKRRDLRIAGTFYLVLNTPIEEGDTVEVRHTLPKPMARELVAQARLDPRRWSPVIHVNQEGYVPSAPKRAVVGYFLGSLGEMPLPGTEGFSVQDVSSGATVFKGVLQLRREQGLEPLSYQQVREADFTAFSKPGEYRLVVPKLGASFPFRIGDGVAAAFARTYALGLYHQRCGCANEFPFTRHIHGPCHMAPAEIPTLKFARTQEFIAGMSSDFKQDPDHTAPQLKDVASSLYPFVRQGTLDVSGGHHDAGDYSKYTINSAGLIHHLVFAADAFPGVGELDNLGIPESGDGRSDILQEAKWEADFLAKMQDNDGGFFFLVYPRERKYEDNVLPDHGDTQVVWPKNTSATAAAVAALAQASSSPLFRKQFPEAATTYLDKAKLGWTFIQSAVKRHGFKGSYQKLTHYGDTFRHDDEIIWAATELFLATGDPKYQTFLERQFDPAAASTRRWTWWRLYEGYGCAARSYAFSVRTGRMKENQVNREFLKRCAAEVLAAGEDQLRHASESAYGTSFPSADKRYQSASWFFPTDRAFDLAAAYQIAAKPEFLEAIWSNLNYEAGCNPVNVSFLTGLGWKRQREIVHQYAQNDRRVLPPSGIPLGSLQTGFAYINTYQKQLGALSFPPDWDKEKPYPMYDRWGDSFNLTTEFVVVNQARSLATAAFLMAQTPLRSQPWKSQTARIQLTSVSQDPVRNKADLAAPGLNLAEARIVWEGKDLEPVFGLSPEISPRNVGSQWLEAEACLPDGRRVFASTEYSAKTVAARNFSSLYKSDPASPPRGAIALFPFNSDLRDVAGQLGELKSGGSCQLDASNLSWMRKPSGAALRIQEFRDRVGVAIPGKAAGGIAQGGVALEALLFIERFAPQGIENIPLLALDNGGKSGIELWQDRWSDTPVLRAGGQILLDREALAAVLTPLQWHRLRVSLDREGYRVEIDDKEIHRVPSQDLSAWKGASELRLRAGSFSGWIDELGVWPASIRASGRGAAAP